LPFKSNVNKKQPIVNISSTFYASLAAHFEENLEHYVGRKKRGKYTKLPQNIPNCHKIYQIAEKYTKLPQNIPNCHKIYQIATKYTKLPKNIPNCRKIYQDGRKIDRVAIHVPTSFIARFRFLV
jgi:hypothetical protein